MAIEIVTGFQGKPHVKANDIAGFQQGVVGTKDYVMGVGKKAKATLVSNNSVRIDDGELVMQGVHFRILPGTYENVTINNGNQGQKRKDAIVARYTKDSSSGIENVTLAVLQGTPTTGTPVAPAPTIGDIRSGALKHEMILYVVELNGLNVVSVTPAFKILMCMKELQDGLDELNSKLENSGWVDLTLASGFAKKGTCAVRKTHEAIEVCFAIATSKKMETFTTAATIPNQYRPKVPMRVAVQANTTNAMACQIETDGTIKLYCPDGTTAWFIGEIIYYQ